MPVNQNQMTALLRFLQGAYSTFEVREPTVASWLTVLGRFEYEEVFRAVHELASKGGAWAPSVGDVAQLVKGYHTRPAVGASDVSVAYPEPEPVAGLLEGAMPEPEWDDGGFPPRGKDAMLRMQDEDPERWVAEHRRLVEHAAVSPNEPREVTAARAAWRAGVWDRLLRRPPR